MRYKDPSYEDKFYDKSRLDVGKQPNGKIVSIDATDGSIIVQFFDTPEPDYVSYDVTQYANSWDDERMGGMWYVDLE